MSAVRFLLACMLGSFLAWPADAEELRVSPAWLADHLQDKNLIVLDARSGDDYVRGHVAGAISFPDSLTYKRKSESGTIVEPDVMQSLLRERGADQNNLIVVYDAGQVLDAARVFWVLEVYGLNQVRLLNGGYAAWTASNLAVSTVSPTPKPSNYVPTINHKRIASKFTTQLATANPGQMVIDARDGDSYEGKKSTATRFGHIPTAKNYPSMRNFRTQDGQLTLRNVDELKTEYSTVPMDKKVVLYCEIGRASAANYLVMRELGYDVSNYDGSWREWGNDLSLPIEK